MRPLSINRLDVVSAPTVHILSCSYYTAVALVAYQVILEPGIIIRQFRVSSSPPRVHTTGIHS